MRKQIFLLQTSTTKARNKERAIKAGYVSSNRYFCAIWSLIEFYALSFRLNLYKDV